MYLSHFALREPPFSITPDPRFLYMSGRHREALAHLVYGVGEHGGFVQLSGEVGTGKTSICRCLLEQLPPQVDVALVLNPRLNPVELLAAVCDELRIPYPPGTTSPKELVDRLYRHLLEAHGRGRRTVLILDEAQNLAPEVLEEVRLLTNLETPREKLLQVILIGQPELTTLLDQPKLRQLAQRITARYHLQPLGRGETRAYIRHRLRVAGRGDALFTEGAMRSMHRWSRGIPRLINAIADRALLGAYTRDASHVDAGTVRRAAAEVLGQSTGGRGWWGGPVAATLAVAAVAAVTLVLLAPAKLGLMAERPGANGAPPASAPPAAVPATAPPPVAVAAPAAPPPPAARSSPALAEVLREPTLAATKGDALVALLGLWRADLTSAQVDCEAPSAGALDCLAAVGTWQKLRRLDLPAALELRGPDGERRYGVVTALTDAEATLRFGDRVVTSLLTDVDPHWGGTFFVLWRPPPVALPVRLGARGPAADWLRERLARAEGTDQPHERGRPYDEDLLGRVVAFQRGRWIEPDGVVGRETAMFLQRSERRPDVPRLSTGTM